MTGESNLLVRPPNSHAAHGLSTGDGAVRAAGCKSAPLTHGVQFPASYLRERGRELRQHSSVTKKLRDRPCLRMSAISLSLMMIRRCDKWLSGIYTKSH